MGQREQLDNAKNTVQEEILTQQTQLNELLERINKAIYKHRVKSCTDKGVTMEFFETSNGSLEEKSVRAEVIKDCIQVILYIL
jgi:hypothetical protein